VVFTLPEGLRPLALRNQKVLYNLVFKSASETLSELASDSKHLGAEIGFMAILHTWSQTLIDHPHLHCLVTGGGLSLDGKRWLRSKKGFFIPAKVLSCLFRGKFLDGLKRKYEAGELRFPGQVEELKEASAFKRFLTNLYHQPWVVYCKPPLKHPEKVVDYLGRYTHRIALSNDRLVKLEDNRVTFRWRDSADNNTIKLAQDSLTTEVEKKGERLQIDQRLKFYIANPRFRSYPNGGKSFQKFGNGFDLVGGFLDFLGLLQSWNSFNFFFQIRNHIPFLISLFFFLFCHFLRLFFAPDISQFLHCLSQAFTDLREPLRPKQEKEDE
jgi:hypothetical protein